MEFKSWNEIERFKGLHVIMTLKLDGTNAQIVITPEGTVLAGKRSSYCTPEQDNYGFAAFVKEHEKELAESLGHGRHYGEWCGPGIQKCTWLKEKTLFLFNTANCAVLPPYLKIVPTIYAGPYNQSTIDVLLDSLKEKGYPALLGAAKPEGVVLYFPQLRKSWKIVFEKEEKPVAKKPGIDYNEVALPFLQPLRLSKLISKDESYLLGFPENLPTIVKGYLDDLVKDTPDMTPEQFKAVKKVIYPFVKEELNNDERTRCVYNSNST